MWMVLSGPTIFPNGVDGSVGIIQLATYWAIIVYVLWSGLMELGKYLVLFKL